MYGEYVECEGYMIWVNCLPTTSRREKEKIAKRKVEVIINEEKQFINGTN